MFSEDNFWSCQHVDLGSNRGDIIDCGREMSVVKTEQKCLGLKSPGCLEAWLYTD